MQPIARGAACRRTPRAQTIFTTKKNTASRFGLTYIMLFVFDTVCNIPYYAFGMELASTPAGRDQVWFWNIVLGLSVSAV